MTRRFLFALFLFQLAAASSVLAQSLKITELAITSKVTKGKPVDAIHRISHRSVTALHCFSRIRSESAEETSISHVWLREGQVVKETVLPVKAKRWRAYSSMPMNAASVGSWQVEVRDPGGAVLRAVKFRIN